MLTTLLSPEQYETFAAVHFLESGDIRFYCGLPVETSVCITRDALGAMHPHTVVLLDKLRDVRAKPHHIAHCLEQALALWALPVQNRHFDHTAQQWVTWDAMTHTDAGEIMLTERRWPGLLYEGIPLITDLAEVTTSVRDAVSWESHFPGIVQHYTIAETLGLSPEDVARYCYEHQYSQPTPLPVVCLPDDGSL